MVKEKQLSFPLEAQKLDLSVTCKAKQNAPRLNPNFWGTSRGRTRHCQLVASTLSRKILLLLNDLISSSLERNVYAMSMISKT